MILGWLIKLSLPYRLLEADVERLRLERDDYREKYVKKCEYIVVSERGPRFDVVEKREAKPVQSQFKSFAEIEREKRSQHDRDFATYLDQHPEDIQQTN